MLPFWIINDLLSGIDEQLLGTGAVFERYFLQASGLCSCSRVFWWRAIYLNVIRAIKKITVLGNVKLLST